MKHSKKLISLFPVLIKGSVSYICFHALNAGSNVYSTNKGSTEDILVAFTLPVYPGNRCKNIIKTQFHETKQGSK